MTSAALSACACLSPWRPIGFVCTTLPTGGTGSRVALCTGLSGPELALFSRDPATCPIAITPIPQTTYILCRLGQIGFVSHACPMLRGISSWVRRRGPDFLLSCVAATLILAGPAANWVCFAHFVLWDAGPQAKLASFCTIELRGPEAAGLSPIRNPQSEIRNQGIGFVLPTLFACPIHHIREQSV